VFYHEYLFITCIRIIENVDDQVDDQSLEYPLESSSLSLEERKAILYQKLDAIEIIDTRADTSDTTGCLESKVTIERIGSEDKVNSNAAKESIQSNNEVIASVAEYAVGCFPTTSLLLQFDQVMTQKILKYQVHWLLKS